MAIPAGSRICLSPAMESAETARKADDSYGCSVLSQGVAET
jgi:hypothetical protein